MFRVSAHINKSNKHYDFIDPGICPNAFRSKMVNFPDMCTRKLFKSAPFFFIRISR